MKPELARRTLGVSSRRNDAHCRDPPTATVPLAVPLGASAFRALDPCVQGRWESRRRPLEPWPRRLLPSTPFPVARGGPFLRRKRDRALSGGLPLLFGRKPTDQCHWRRKERGRRGRLRVAGEMDWKGSCHSVHIAEGGQPSASAIIGNHGPFCMQGLVNLCSF